jgi:hypothetical protein
VVESVVERSQRQWPRPEEETEGMVSWRLVALAPARTKDLGARVPGNVEEKTAWPLLLEEGVAVEDGVLLLVGEIQCGGGFSPNEFRRGF